MHFFKISLFATGLFFLSSTCFAQTLSIKGQSVVARTGAGEDYPVVLEFDEGFPLKIIQKKEDWTLVEDFEKERAWVHKDSLDEKLYVIVNLPKNPKHGRINIRQGTNTKTDVVAKAKHGVVFQALEQKNGWTKVYYAEKELVGWIKNTLLWGLEK